jgi:photosystem II stability/assembly factor-like uncharacterized protein
MKSSVPRTLLVCGIISCIFLLLVRLTSPTSHDDRNERHPDRDESAAAEEDIDGRNDWFIYQRAYPFGSIPADSRRNAWRSISRFEAEALHPAASNRWTPIGPSPTTPFYLNNWGVTSGRVNAVAVSPANSRIVLAGSSTGGIWRSTDSGDTFIPVSDDQVDLAVGSIAFSKSNPSIAYAGMGDTKLGYLGSGVLKSTDSGDTWVRVSNSSLPSPGTTSKIEIDAGDPNQLYVAQYVRVSQNKQTSSGIYVSTDGGVNWTRTLGGGGRDVVIDPSNSRNVYAGIHRIDPDKDPQPGLYRSTDRGQTWTNQFTNQYDITRRRDIRIAISPANPSKIYVYTGGALGSYLDLRLFTSTDGGASWSDRVLEGFDAGQLGYNTYLAADPRNENTLYLGSRDAYRSTDGGFSWLNLTQNFNIFGTIYDYTPEVSKSHSDQHAIAFSPDNPNRFYIANDGGISRTDDRGATFQSLNATLSLTQFIGLALHPTDPGITYGGTQDNGTQRRFSDSSRWHEISMGDGGRTVIDAIDPSTVFVTYVRGSIFRYRNDGSYFETQVAFTDTFGETFDSPRMAFYPPFIGNGVDSTLYFGTWRLFTSTDAGNSWSAPAASMDLTKGVNAQGVDVLSAIAVARSNTNAVYTGSVQGRAMFSNDGGHTWIDRTTGLPDRSITSITVDPARASLAYLTMSGFGSGHVFKTSDSGTTWADVSYNLPDIPANALLIDPFDGETLYLGTDVGVFKLTAGSQNWRSFNNGVPPVVIHAFAAQASGLIQVATYGRGAYEMVLPSPPLISSAEFDGKKNLTIEGHSFGDSPRVLINGTDVSDRLRSSSDTAIKLKGKSKKLGLISGENSIQVVAADGSSSNVFTLRQ